MYTVLPLLSVLLAWSTAAGAQKDSDMPFMEYLDPNQLVKLKWGFSDLQGNIMFALSINTTGWVGFGLSPHGGMSGSDIVMGGVRPSGTYFKDYHATGNDFPLVDKQQSYSLLSLAEVEGQTTMTFQRSIQSCDMEDFQITTGPIKLIYAYGATDDIGYHAARRGTKEVNLLSHRPRVPPPGPHYFSVSVNNISLPATDHYYHCKVVTLPRLLSRAHIYQIEPFVEQVDIVHHMLLYVCQPVGTKAYDGTCHSRDVEDSCYAALAGWGMGGGAFVLPQEAGIPIPEKASTFVKLVIHYSNPAKTAGRRDSSGLRMYFTHTLRQHEVSILLTGLLDPRDLDHRIPPGAAQFHTHGVCNTSLFSKVVKGPVPDLQVISMLVHTHSAGRRVRVGHFRNGTQVNLISMEGGHNFEMQHATDLGNIKTLKQGDELLLECTYNTTSYKGFTKMGFAATDELCLAFLLFYPALDIGSCGSHPDMVYVNNILEETGNHVLKNISLSKPPDHDAITAYEELLKTAPQHQMIGELQNIKEMDLNGAIRTMMEVPSVICQNDPILSRAAPKQLSTCWNVKLAAGMMLLWKAGI